MAFKAILGFLFVLLIATIAVLAIVCYNNNEDAAAAAIQLNHSHHVLEKADDVLSTYQAARLSVNNMVIRKDTARHRAYLASLKTLTSELDELRALTADNRRQQLTIDSLIRGLQQFATISDTLIKLVRAKRSEAQIRTVFLNNSAFSADLTSRIETLKSDEKAMLAQHQIANEESIKTFKETFIFLLIGILILLATTFFSIRYYINKRQKAQEELVRANVLFEKVFYESPIAIVISELETGKILNCNRVFANTVNYEINELLGKTPVELGIIESEAKRKEIVEGSERKGMTRHTEDFIRPRGKEPIYISLDAHVVPLFNRKCLLTAIVDLSTHKRAEDEIRKALEAEIELNKLKSNLVTLASHEFRTPLTTILSSAFLLENFIGGEHQEKFAKHLARIKSSVRNLTSILDEFLSVTKIEEGHVQPNIERTDLPKYLSGICSNLQTFAKRGQVIHYSHSGENEIDTDPVLLGNILSNLVTNSIKYSGENSPIFVTSLVNSETHLTVKDEGIGISEPDQKRLFERFYRASNAGAVQGTGLGLHIMKHYVEMLGGSVKLTSELGKGTNVEVTFDRR